MVKIILNSGLLILVFTERKYMWFRIFCEGKSSLTTAAGVLNTGAGSYAGCGTVACVVCCVTTLPAYTEHASPPLAWPCPGSQGRHGQGASVSTVC